MDAVAALKSSQLFKGFTETGLQIIASIATFRNFPKGAPIFVESMLADAMYVVAAGQLRLSATGEAGEEIPLGEVGPGAYLGELSLIQPGQRMCTATALTEVSALEVRHEDFQKLVGAKPQACIKLLMSIVSLFGQKVAENRDAFRSLIAKM